MEKVVWFEEFRVTLFQSDRLVRVKRKCMN